MPRTRFRSVFFVAVQTGLSSQLHDRRGSRPAPLRGGGCRSRATHLSVAQNHARSKVGLHDPAPVGGSGVEQASEPEPADHPAADPLGNGGQISVRDRSGWQKRRRGPAACSAISRHEDAVGCTHVQMRVPSRWWIRSGRCSPGKVRIQSRRSSASSRCRSTRPSPAVAACVKPALHRNRAGSGEEDLGLGS